MLAFIAVSRFGDHLPYYRISQSMKREGIILSPVRMGSWIGALYHQWLSPVLAAISAEVLLGTALGVDETPIKYLPPKAKSIKASRATPGSKAGDELERACQADAESIAASQSDGGEVAILKKTKQGYLWVLHRPGVGTIFHWSVSRAHGVLLAMLPDQWSGILVCDDYAAYRTFRDLRLAQPKRYGKITLAACMAHIRRKFIQAEKQAPAEVAAILKEIGKLYVIEAELREKHATPEAVLHRRETECRPLLDALKKRLEELQAHPDHLLKSALGTAIRYFINQWEELQPYLTNAVVPLDNNATERAIRGTAVGKKNYLFFGSEESGAANAAIYTLVESAKDNGLDPLRYLEDLFTALPTMQMSEAPSWTPHAYADRQKASADAAAAATAAGSSQAKAAA